MSEYHIPVLLDECLKYLDVKPGGTYLDCTMGGGGHSFAMAKIAGDNGLVIGIDRDIDAINEVTSKLSTIEGRMIVEKVPFSRFSEALIKNNIGKVDGILLDIGVSSHQFDAGTRGFSYRYNAPLDMRMDRENGRTVADIINEASQEQILLILKRFGEVKNPARMAAHICKERKNQAIITTGDFITALNKEYGSLKNGVLSKIFQGFRIAANGELEELTRALSEAVEWLKPGGKVAVISYHSLEDRIVKNFFRDEAAECICPPELPFCQCDHCATLKLVTRKAVVPKDEEIAVNVRARSAKLRVAQRVACNDEEKS